jgi:hypothetical protein
MTIGREVETGLLILDSTISRQHAYLDKRTEAWTLRDLGSSNGSYVEACSFGTVMAVRDGERIRFGSISFFFLEDVGAAPKCDTALDGFTQRVVNGVIKTKEMPRLRVHDITVELREPSGGGGGMAIIDGRHVQLTLPQFELVSLLYQRARVGTEHEDVRGFVHPMELARVISLDTAMPTEDHVRQLVRRLRRVLFKAGITNVIESRYGAGYRLRLRAM